MSSDPNQNIFTTKLGERLSTAAKDFKTKALSEINDNDYHIPVNKTTFKKVVVRCSHVTASLSFLLGSSTIELQQDLKKHLDSLEKLLIFCSSPKSFSSAWSLRNDVLTGDIANRLVNEGAQLIPANARERLFTTNQQGVELGINRKLILAVRHSKGNYDDDLDNQGRFTYQPPNNTNGMLRYRWCQFLQQRLGIPYVLIAVIWFEYRINDSLNNVFLVSPAAIVDPEMDTENLGTSLSNPLTLRLIERSEAYDSIRLLRALDETSLDMEVRKSLDLKLAEEWSYSQIDKLSKGNKLKIWAKRMGFGCPDGSKCGHVKFENIKNSDMAFGHIIPQNWARTFPHHLSTINHPDNLYLTCKRCNESLSDDFPNRGLIKTILEMGSVGDWLRKYDQAIREIRV